MQNRRHFLTAAAALLALPASAAFSAPAAPYTRLSRSHLKENPDKIEVIEFFSYGCGHCNDFNPIIKAWAARQPADLAFRRIPVAWNAAWKSLAKLYYALEASGDLARLDEAVFDALHKQRKQLYTDRNVVDWYVQQGGNGQKFADLLKSFAVASKMNQAEQLRDSMQVDVVPTLVVEGLYKVSGNAFEELLKNTDLTVAQVRAQRSKK
ncbi:MAG: thiol:disulfide interchange protein DsbA/DsbL [Zoogloeaceae bacterium]|jgi:thiol:disulfide interchange protein DsbA|nr:thiol:disulfide interchange protein DsbA/DsbL [Zoogloeaceae bacterium]